MDALEDALEGLGMLGEHLARARAALATLPGGDDDGAEAGPGLRALGVAEAAMAAVEAMADGVAQRGATGMIAIERDLRQVRVLVAGAVTADEAAMVVAEVRRRDARLAAAAALVGVLLGLSARWVAAGFAPPVVLHALASSVPRLLALGEALEAAA